jgi:hypothetical protein
MSKHNRRDNGSATEAGVAQEDAQGVDIQTGEVKSAAEPAAAPKLSKAVFVKKIVAKALIERKELRYARFVKGGEDSTDEVDYPPRALYRVFGSASGTFSGESQYGPWTGFDGAFEAIRFKDHAHFRSNKCFLQEPAEGLLIEALRQAKLQDSSASLRFGFDIGVKVSQRWLDTDEGNSYEYTVESIFETEEADPLAQLRGAAVQALPPPTT